MAPAASTPCRASTPPEREVFSVPVEARTESGNYTVLRYRWPGLVEPGQFVMARAAGYPATFDPFLARPFSFYDHDGEWASLLFEVRGRGTSLLDRAAKIEVSAPLGRGFRVEPSGMRAALLGGGVGVAPLKILGRRLDELGVRHDVFPASPTAPRRLPQVISRRGRGDDGRVGGDPRHGARCGPRPRELRGGLCLRPQPDARRREAGRRRGEALPALGGGEDGVWQRVVQWVRGPCAWRRLRQVLRRGAGLQRGGPGVVVRERMAGARLEVELCGIPLKTPLIPASGTLAKEALGEVEGVYGAILPKTTTPSPRAGNPPPRVAETPAGMVNSIGLQNPGVEGFLRDLDAFDLGVPLFVSAAGDTVEEFGALCERLGADERIAAIELNLSCPNVECGGLTFCATPQRSRTWSRLAGGPRASLCSPSSPSRAWSRTRWRLRRPGPTR